MENHGGILIHIEVKEDNLKRLHTVCFQLHDSSWKGKTMKIMQISVLIGRREKICIGEAQRIFRATKYSIWYHNEEYVSLHICPKPQVWKPRENPKITYELWVIIMCRYRFTLGQKCPLLLMMLTMGGHMCGGRRHVRNLYLPLHSAGNL